MTSRDLAWHIMRAALKAVDPAEAVRRYLRRAGHHLTVTNPQSGQRVYNLAEFDRVLAVGVGKAGAPMAAAAAEILGERLAGGVVIVKYGHGLANATATGPLEVIEAGHPVPDESGQQGAQKIANLLENATARDLVLCLLSGGGSALMTVPVTGVSLADLQTLTHMLLTCGATINEINTLRKHLSRLTGGQLARLAAPATVISLILSDVVGDPLDVIASGPTVPDPTTFADAWAVLTRYDVADNIPVSVKTHLQAGLKDEIPDTPKPGAPLVAQPQNVIVGSNRLATRAAAAEAERLGLAAIVLSTFIEGEAREVGRVVAGLAKGLAQDEVFCPAGHHIKPPACLILGGETTVTVRGDGLGGRNQEMALAAALALDGWPHVLVACLATDGSDGPTAAAGAFADGLTLARARALGLEASAYLACNDAYHFFEPLGDLIVTGPTRTNVNDLTLVLVEK